ncbi:MAG: AraC family transcriptional regulator [Lachnospiraceae bacterium]|nr:AraC family transcriptional regulator [Lachnospiraceae bacterium]
MRIENETVVFRGELPGVFAEEVSNLSGGSMQTRHIHESVELYFLLEGERYYFVAQDTYHIRPKMAILINSNTIHKTSSCGQGQHYRRFLMQLDMETLSPALSALGYPAEDLGERFAGPAEFSDKAWEAACGLIREIENVFAAGGTFAKPEVWALTFLLIGSFLDARMESAALIGPVRADGSGVEGETFARVHEIAVFLQNNCAETIDLDSLAARYFVSKSYLTRIFRRTTGFTVTEYRTYCRVAQAKTLLAATDADITDIAARTGFGNITYFERVFRQNAGMTPSQYRRQLKGKHGKTSL